jgi:hypothetical protein
MNFQLTLSTIKPANTEWWWILNSAKMNIIDNYIKSLPGFVSYSQELKTPNTREQSIVFDSNANLQNYFKEINLLPEAIERRVYNDINNINTHGSIQILE